MNLIRGRIVDDGRSFVLEGGPTLGLPAPAPQFNERDVLLGLRPEHLTLGSSGLPLTVELVEALGADVLIHGKVGEQGVIVRVPDGPHPAFGETIHVGFAGARMYWFDPATGSRCA